MKILWIIENLSIILIKLIRLKTAIYFLIVINFKEILQLYYRQYLLKIKNHKMVQTHVCLGKYFSK